LSKGQWVEIVLFVILLKKLSVTTIPCLLLWGNPSESKPVGKSFVAYSGKDIERNGLIPFYHSGTAQV